MALTPCIFLGLVLLPGSGFTQLAGAAQVEGNQSFSRSLDQPLLVNHSCTVGSYAFDASNATLGVYCNTDDVNDFAYDWTFIDTNLCIGNNNGTLVASPEGNFSDSCKDCNVTWSHVDLNPVTTTFTTAPHAWTTYTVTSTSTPHWDDLYLGCGGCTNRDYQLNPATVDLNKIMVNENGTIGCHTYTGTTMHAKPSPTTAVAFTRRGVCGVVRDERPVDSSLIGE